MGTVHTGGGKADELTLDLAKLPGEDEATSAPENADGEVAAGVLGLPVEAGEAGG